MMSGNEFDNAANSLGLAPWEFLHFVRPAILASSLLETIKRLAGLLQEHTPTLKRTAALEVIAKAIGFQHWHEFNSYAKGLVQDFVNRPDGFRPAEALPQLARLSGAAALLRSVPESLPPVPSHQTQLETLADALTVHGIEHSVALNSLARLHRAPSWRALIERQAAKGSLPLYEFLPPKGPHDDAQFVRSPACSELVEQQDALYQGYDDLPASEQRQLEVWVRETLAKRPDFLEGYLALGTVLEARDDTYFEAGPLYAQAIDRAEALIPKGFKGEISWDFIENRFYHRLLYARMCWCAWTGKYPTAVALARKQLRRNKYDNLGIRCLLPSMLVAAGRLDEAHSFAERRLRKGADGAGCFLALSIGCLAAGDLAAAKRDLLQAMFSWPPLRLLVSGKRGTAEQWRDTRSIIPDPRQCHFAYQIASEGAPIERLFKRWLAEPATIKAEAELKPLWDRVWPAGGGFLRSECLEEWRIHARGKALELAQP